jgi:hypothetical protein
MECPGWESQQLGFTDLTVTDLLAQCAQENYSMVYIHLHGVLSSFPNLWMFCIEFVRGLVRIGDSPALELFSLSSVILLDIAEDRSAGHVRDGKEEEAFRHQRMRNIH